MTVHFTLKTLQHWIPQNPVTKQVCGEVKCGLVSEMVTRVNPNFFISEILNFGTAVVFQVFHLFIQYFAKNIAIFCSFCKVFNLYSPRKNAWKLTVIQTSFVPHNTMQVSCAAKRLFCEFVHFWRTNWVSLKFAIKKTPTSSTTFLFAISMSPLVHCKTYCFKSWQSWKQRAERVLR